MRRSVPLTAREQEILSMVAEGLTDKQVAVALGLQRKTVSNHMSIILLKLGASARTQAVTSALRQGLIALPGITTQV